MMVTALVVAMSGAVAGSPAAQAARAGSVLYSPNLATYPSGTAGYPRAIRLDQDGSPNETMLATFARGAHNGPTTMPVYRSTDGGGSWAQISSISSNTPGWDIEAPTLFEVPRSIPGLAAGTILAAGTAWQVGDYTAQKVEVFKSTNGGSSWTFLSNCTSTSGQPNGWGHGIWEPTFLVADNDALACFISDERPANTPTNNQLIGHYTSTDGGVTWGSTLTQDVAFPADNLLRPGMQTFAELPNGEFVMTYEMCRDATDPDDACEVYLKRSADGLNWGPLGDRGTLVRTTDDRELLHTPYVAWVPGGGPDGTLMVSGQRVVSGPTGNKTVLAESGSVLFVNRALGNGPWTEAETPVTVDPTGGYAAGVASCPGYSTPMVPRQDGTSYVYFAATLLTGSQCELRTGIGTLPGPTGAIIGAGGKCLDVDTNTAVNGRPAQLWTCGTATGQDWSVDADGTVRAFGRCLDVDANGTTNGTKVQLWECNGAGAQQWRAQSDGTLLNPQSGKCLDVPSGNTADGTDLQIYTCNGSPAQAWVLPGFPTGRITGPDTAPKCVDVDTNTPTSGNRVGLWDCSGVPGQQWTMRPDGTVRAFGKCLDVQGNGVANATPVQLWDCNGGGAQVWVPQANGSLRNPQSGRCLDAPAGSASNGTKLQIYDCNGQAPQRWTVPV
ncbi:ricin-type beta-trefoil lectin domain protein [Phycicoccus sp. BSK3Z-2]|uniref:Ricin-type beta-trefoil lectin domain protein n=1 Tax=Phycicoccus avicenniae TaxID=2828860 RepID=A0A941D462_9MICO|nr:sialidase family protein [Phycicoccus avicenniae]MBR7741779.1 ricin-type beta-trefoil lectin domain protein [Phycicoccus avicenniae]